MATKQLTFDEFRASRRPCDDTTWADLVAEGLVPGLTQEQCFLYADGYMIHEADRKHYVHAWWYSPVGYEDRDVAEQRLLDWYREFN